ncbi:hypothetical protein P154DRAFT_256732 [Amniculicola lignicola CBS 123094]|uniref:Tyrosine specific protein phosphatases domain-containing protein n=1 Tax=Amniculicola lignicola CBS 123094 TaxID=1392246 RepID=A0A6A5WX45_9PLEO|nr:hypothetical protein P154DRAFT_256732 [Amniculicola lignicola CBS 123094]
MHQLLPLWVRNPAPCPAARSIHVMRCIGHPKLGMHDRSAHLRYVDSTDPGLLKKHSTFESYSVPITGFTYPSIRTFFRPHPQQSKLPNEPHPIPLLVFIHGLGGSVAQFNPILISLVNLAPSLAIDLPGCGRSTFHPKDWKAYTTDALVQLLAVAIEAHRDRDANQKVILVAHSMGCSLAALLASSTSPHAALISEHIVGLVAICPQAEPPSEKQRKALIRATSIPSVMFDLIRKWDRRGGVDSRSVTRMVGPDAEEKTKKLQLRFNEQSQTNVWRRMARGMIPDYSGGIPAGGLPGKDVWSGLRLPVFLAAGEADHLTPPDNAKLIAHFLGRDIAAMDPPSDKASLPMAAAPIDPGSLDPALAERPHHDSGIDANDLPRIKEETTVPSTLLFSPSAESLVNDDNISTAGESATIGDDVSITNAPASISTSNVPLPHPRHLVVKTVIFPKPASHSLLFAPSTSRSLSGLVGDFFADHIDPRLSLGWQLQYLTTEGKWDVKNLKKWSSTEPVSLPLADTFRAMKTLREVDEQHSPKIFVKDWAGKIRVVVDISHGSPVYDPKGLEAGGIKYYKFPCVSKMPPQTEEVKAFIELIDTIRADKSEDETGLIGVHCHYGFNRTGFFLVCYLVERLKYRVEEAIDAFATARPIGIKHAHFIDALHVRYAVGLRKAPTL